MRIQFQSGELALTGRSAVSLKHGQALRLRCESGTLWITQDNVLTDVVLYSGETRLLGRSARTVISTPLGGDASFSLRAAGMPVEPHTRRARRLQQQAIGDALQRLARALAAGWRTARRSMARAFAARRLP